MTTTQAPAPTNGHCAFPPPFPVEHPVEPTDAPLPTDQANNNQVVERQKGVPITPLLAHENAERQQRPFAASAYHVPPKVFAPKPHAYRHDDYLHRPVIPSPLPERCQFMFSDGRQCTMARSDIHPSLCVYHSEREEQLFGDPFCESHIRGRSYDLPELYSASRDLSTAAGVNRALAQVFRLLAQRRISRQEAATFGHLAQLLLRSISAARAELTDMPEPAPRQQAAPAAPPSSNLSASEEAVAVVPDTSQPQAIESNSRAINTSANRASNSSKINTYEITGLEPVQNEHLRTMQSVIEVVGPEKASPRESHGNQELSRVQKAIPPLFGHKKVGL